MSKATRSLFQSSLAPFTPSNVESLSRLHPPASSTVLPHLPSSAPRIHVDSSIIATLVSEKVANGSAPVPSSWQALKTLTA